MDAGLRAFRDLLRSPDVALDLGRAALAVAAVEHPDLEPAEHLARLDALARASGAARAGSDRARLDRLRAHLFETLGFRGNAGDYYAPRNSCLNDVLDRRTGIPITLSVLTMEVGRRAGLTIDGVGLPGHFVVAARLAAETVLLDPFGGGGALARREAEALVARAVGRPVTLKDEHFAPATKAQIVVRMLRNLHGVYTRRGEWDKALAAVDRLLAAEGEAPAHLRDRGTALVHLGRVHHGAAEWERYLVRYPKARDAAQVRDELRRVRQALAERN